MFEEEKEEFQIRDHSLLDRESLQSTNGKLLTVTNEETTIDLFFTNVQWTNFITFLRQTEEGIDKKLVAYGAFLVTENRVRTAVDYYEDFGYKMYRTLYGEDAEKEVNMEAVKQDDWEKFEDLKWNDEVRETQLLDDIFINFDTVKLHLKRKKFIRLRKFCLSCGYKM